MPSTEKRGRRHSSEVTVVVFDTGGRPSGTAGAEPSLDRSEVRLDLFRASGAGGQRRNKVETCVRAVHLPTGITVIATESRHQHENRKVALARLQSALDARSAQQAHDATNAVRQDTFGQGRVWTWTGWRDEVKGPDGRKSSMRRALSGRLGPLLK